MVGVDKLRLALLDALDAVEDASPVSAVEATTRDVGEALGASSVRFLVADLSGRSLVRLTHIDLSEEFVGRFPGLDEDRDRNAQDAETVVPLDGGPEGQALRQQAVQLVPPGEAALMGPWTVFAPVSHRGEAVGVLVLTLPTEPEATVLAEIVRTAHLLGFVVIASRLHTDHYEWGQRAIPFSLSAEIQRRLLPPAFTCVESSLTLSGWVEPADHIGGDTFDYSLGRDVLHLSMTDAMGHGVNSSLAATLCVGSLRNSRRLGVALLEQARRVNEALVSYQAGPWTEGFVTGLLGRLQLSTGILTVVNAGHVPPYLLRGGVVSVLEFPADLPFGLFEDSTFRSTDFRLEPGDRLVFVTDGMLERNAAELDLPSMLLATRESHPREATRELADMVLEATGHALGDDATLLILDWHDGHAQDRHTLRAAPSQRPATP
ncbi:MAG TPA: PP2C family protein-serine/threonine phosphatase [Frankiaceae bacterium]|nr:PP2C family protein-serine/threonine phosphatase [Frankiaceae bacterium]